jgi:hypothetical protein
MIRLTSLRRQIGLLVCLLFAIALAAGVHGLDVWRRGWVG